MHSLENHTPIQTKIGKIYTRFQTKTAQQPYPLGAAHTYKANIREYLPPTGIVRNIPPCVIQSSQHLPIHHILCRTTGTLASWGWPAK